MVDAISTALSGLQINAQKLNESANNIARAGTQGLDTAPEDLVNLSEEAINLLQAETGFKANIQVIEAAEEQFDSLLDALDNDDE